MSRTRLAVVTAVDGSLTNWAPVPGYGSTAGNTDGNRTLTNEVLSMVLTNGNTQLVVSGRFRKRHPAPPRSVMVELEPFSRHADELRAEFPSLVPESCVRAGSVLEEVPTRTTGNGGPQPRGPGVPVLSRST